MLPTLFVSHGAPTLIAEEGPARDFLKRAVADLGRPSAILIVSAHWETAAPAVAATATPATIHDFYGFPESLYRLRYAAPGAPDLATRVASLLSRAGFGAGQDATRGLDHGAWVPLMLMYPSADIPVTQLSIQPQAGPAHHLAVGRALAPLRGDDVLVVASGGAVHNLRALAWNSTAPPAEWARRFDDWLVATIEQGSVDDLVAYRERAPGAAQAHPRDEHLLPLFVALGAAGPKAHGTRIFGGFSHGSLSMAAFRFS
jgi:4,5-DOPA dioxygenase extradiol